MLCCNESKCTIMHCTALHSNALYCITLHCSALHCVVLHRAVWRHIVSKGGALPCSALLCAILYELHGSVLRCSVLLCNVSVSTTAHYTVVHCAMLRLIALRYTILHVTILRRGAGGGPFAPWPTGKHPSVAAGGKGVHCGMPPVSVAHTVWGKSFADGNSPGTLGAVDARPQTVDDKPGGNRGIGAITPPGAGSVAIVTRAEGETHRSYYSKGWSPI